MSDDALLSTPGPGRGPQSSGGQEGRMDEGWGRGPEARMQQGAWEAPWLATGGHPSGANPFSPPMPQATGHYGPGYGDPARHFSMDPDFRTASGADRDQASGRASGPAGTGQGDQAGGGWHDEHHHHYQRFREEHARQLDDEYRAWCEDCARQGAAQGEEDTRRGRHPHADTEREGRSEGMLQGLGRAITEVVTGPREPDHDQRIGYNERDRAFDGGTQREQRAQTDRFFERS